MFKLRDFRRTTMSKIVLALLIPVLALAVAAGSGFAASAAKSARPAAAAAATAKAELSSQSVPGSSAAGPAAPRAAAEAATLIGKPRHRHHHRPGRHRHHGRRHHRHHGRRHPAGRHPRAATPQDIAWQMISSFGWRPRFQFRYLRWLWQVESHWQVHAMNPYSGAYGIPQALPGGKMASAGPNWQNSARTQIRWGMRYIRAVYGSPQLAWDHEQAYGWY